MDTAQIAAIGTAFAAVLTALGGVFLGLRTRTDKDEEELLKRLTRELDEARKKIIECEAVVARERESGQRWYTRTLYWYGRCADMRNAARAARQAAESMARLNKLDRPEWEDSLDMKPMDDATASI